MSDPRKRHGEDDDQPAKPAPDDDRQKTDEELEEDTDPNPED